MRSSSLGASAERFGNKMGRRLSEGWDAIVRPLCYSTLTSETGLSCSTGAATEEQGGSFIVRRCLLDAPNFTTQFVLDASACGQKSFVQLAGPTHALTTWKIFGDDGREVPEMTDLGLGHLPATPCRGSKHVDLHWTLSSQAAAAHLPATASHSVQSGTPLRLA